MKNIFFVGFLLCSIFTYSQDLKNGFVSLNAGPSLPSGDFKADDVTEISSSFAKTGFLLDLNIGFNLSEKIGLMAKFRHYNFAVNDSKMEQNFMKYGPFHRIFINSDPWEVSGGYSGVFVMLPVGPEGKTGIFDFKVLAGISRTVKPRTNIDLHGKYGTEKSIIFSRKATSAAFIFGGGFKYFLSKSVAFNINADYFYTSAEFEKGEQLSISDDRSAFIFDLLEYEQNVEILSFSFGVSCMF